MKALALTAAARLLAHWRLKLALSAALTLFFCVPYFTLQRVTVFPVRQLAPGFVDDTVAFAPEWVWVYQSVYLLLSLIPWLSVSSNDLRRYARGFVLLSAVGFGFFLFLPLEVPRPQPLASHTMFRLLVSYDRPLNTFPSLHVGLAVYTVLYGAWISRDLQPHSTRIAFITASSLWAATVAFSTLATKQHYFVDLIAGAVLAVVCHRWTFTLSCLRSAHEEPVPSHSPGRPVVHLPHPRVVTNASHDAATGASSRFGSTTAGRSRP